MHYQSDTALDNSPMRFSTLASNVLSGARELAAAHGEQLKSELRAESTRGISAIVMLGVGSVITLIAVLFGLVALVQLLQMRYDFSPATSWGLVAIIAAVIGLAALFFAWSQIRSVHLVPTHSLKSIQESLQWVTTR